MKVVKKLTYFALAVVLTACGGGGTGSGAGVFGASSDGTTAAASSSTGKGVAGSTQKLDDSWGKVADEGQSFSLASATVVQYGANDSWVQRTVTDPSAPCTNGFFGQDPAPNVVKACYTQAGAAAPATTPVATAGAGTRLAGENESFSVASATQVQYGAGSNWAAPKTVTGSAICSNAVFGPDPAYGMVKACYTVATTATTTPATTTSATTTSATTTPAAPTTGTRLAGENESFSVASATQVQFGAGSNWAAPKTVTGSAICSNAAFGPDPAYGMVKACYSLGAATGTGSTGGGATVPPVATTSPPLPNDILNSAGAVDTAAYRATAAAMSKEGGIAYRYGAPGSSSDQTTLPQPQSKQLGAPFSNTFPVFYQYGGPQNIAHDDYSSNHAQAAFVADNPTAGVGGVGVASLETLGMRENTFTMSPGLPWVGYGSGLDDSSALAYNARGPVAIGRGYGRPTWNTNALMAFQSGLLGGAGSNTSARHVTAQLEAGYVPTAVAVANGGEFAFITVWDTVNIRGKLAVVALSELGNDTWRGVAYPGLPNQGAWGFMKIVGYVDLGDDMKAPTDVSVTTGVDDEAMHRLHFNNDPQFVESTTVDLRTESNRVTFSDGGSNAHTFARGGIAVVISKSEKKAKFIDLKPLADHYRKTYFTTRANFDAAVNNLGQGANQWPQTFTVTPSQTPTIIKTESFASRPTAVKVALYANQRGWIATEDGTLHIYSLGAYLDGGSAVPGAIASVGTVGVGKNPTSIVYNKKDLQGGKLIVVSRGERKIDWVSLSGNGGSITRTLRDTRLVDPISAEDNDNHGTESSILTVADYGGKQISNYSSGPVIFHSNPGGACSPPNGCGSSAFVFGGSYKLPGKPFQVSGANVP